MDFTPKEYQSLLSYKGGNTIDKSIMYNYFFSPLCNWLVEFLPSWLAPNVLTMFGLFCNYAAFFLSIYYINDFKGEAPSWVYLTCAILLFLYILADNSDGKQARRTGSSSPLGELIDHGCDSQTIIVGAIALCSAIQTGPFSPVIVSFVGILAFYLAHWEEHFNHALILGMLNGPTEAETMAILIYLITYILGPSFWINPIQVGSYVIIPNQVVIIGTCFGAVTTAIQTFFRGTGLILKEHELIKAYSQMIPFLIFYSFGLLWFISNPVIYNIHPYLFLTALSFVFSYVTINCIIQRMFRTEYSYFYLILIPLILVSLNSFIGSMIRYPLIDEKNALYFCWITSLLLLLKLCNNVLNGICNVVKIKAWSIPYPNKATKR